MIEKSEFRVFLVALRQRLEYLQAFAQIDVGGDGSVELQEFVDAQGKMERWVGKLADPVAEFKKIDRDHGGRISYDEFCAWSVAKNLDLDDDAGEK